MSTYTTLTGHNYENAIILAPMVRVGTLPMRLMALEYGADLVYTPEVVDKGIIGATRVVNEDNGTIDYMVKGVSVFRTHPSEKDKLVFQVGSANADLALEAALTVAQDVSTIDLNCGCPKRFSVHGGMGAALMEEPEKLCGILRKLVEHSGLPVTCKIRIFDDREKTLNLVRMIEKTGIKALTVHCRTRDERPRNPGHWDRFKEIVETVKIPVIANGDVFEFEHLQKLRELSGVVGVMVARGAQSNVSVFRKEGPLPLLDIVKQYIRKCLETRNLHSNTKYVLMQMFSEQTKSPQYRPLCDAKNFRSVCQVFEMEAELDAWIASQEARGLPTDLDTVPRKIITKPEETAGPTKRKADQLVEEKDVAADERRQETPATVPTASASTTTTTTPAAAAATAEEEEHPSKLRKPNPTEATSGGASSQPTPVHTPKEANPAAVDSTTTAS